MKKHTLNLSFNELPRKDNGAAVKNPYCGFYKIYRFNAHSTLLPETDIEISQCPISSDEVLCLVEINLSAYSGGDISAEGLGVVRHIFEMFTEYVKQMIVRFLYDWNGCSIQTEPKDIKIIQNHMTALSPLLKEFTDSIYILQGLFIGNWGEMHGGRYNSQTSLSLLAKTLKDAAGDKTFLSVRSPALWRMLSRSYNPVEEYNSYGDTLAAKLGLFNDGMLASETDFGTYGNIFRSEAKSLDDKLIREQEIKFQERLCRFVPNGGEVINECRQNDAEAAIQDLKTMHVSYLNSEYDKKVLEKWKKVIMPKEGGAWKNRSAYEYIADHLGYRFLISSAGFRYLSRSNSLRFNMTVINRGFAPCYRKLKADLILVESSGDTHIAELETDTRRWYPSMPKKLSADVDIDENNFGKKGLMSLRCYVRLFDDCTGKAINFADSYFGASDERGTLIGVLNINNR